MYDLEAAGRVAIGGQPLSDVVCWTRMQAEAGQALGGIIARKEAERSAGAGLFCWGVGNPPSKAVGRVRSTDQAVDIVFSIMKSKPKAHDVTPAEILVWRSYVDSDGVVRPLPESSLVTSRAETLTKAKMSHYALMCLSPDPLTVGDYGPFDPSAYRNMSDEGGMIGNSQVTALVRRVAEESTDTAYRINLRATLTAGYWVRLTNPSTLSDSRREKLTTLNSDVPQGREWLRLVEELRSGVSLREEFPWHQPSLF